MQISRRNFVGLCGATAVTPILASCGSSQPAEQARLVVYCSLDRDAIEPVLVKVATAQDVGINLVTDTEATKTTGLVQRLMNERGRPRGDIWISGEVVGTSRLAKAGILDSLPSEVVAPGAWPSEHIAQKGLWAQFSLRPRRLAYNTILAKAHELPTKLQDLSLPRWRGRVCIAKPQFGSTRGHFAALLVLMGPEAFTAMIQGWKANDVRLVDGNSSVVRAVSRGESHLGLTDSDDVYAGQREAWPLDFARGVEAAQLPATPASIGLIKGGPNTTKAAVYLQALLLSGDLERTLAGGDWKAVPVSLTVRSELNITESPTTTNWPATADRVDEMLGIWQRVFG